MIQKKANELMQQYISGWKKNNLHMITSCLSDDCVVIESHGPTYHGIRDIEQWFKPWLDAKSEISKWNVISFSFYEKEKTAFCEWDFVCVSNDIEYSFLGISVVKFSGDKINFIHEYRMTHPAYDWKGDKLKSE